MTCSEFLLQSFRRSPIADIREWNGLGSIWASVRFEDEYDDDDDDGDRDDDGLHRYFHKINVGSFVKNSKLLLNAFQRSKKALC